MLNFIWKYVKQFSADGPEELNVFNVFELPDEQPSPMAIVKADTFFEESEENTLPYRIARATLKGMVNELERLFGYLNYSTNLFIARDIELAEQIEAQLPFFHSTFERTYKQTKVYREFYDIWYKVPMNAQSVADFGADLKANFEEFKVVLGKMRAEGITLKDTQVDQLIALVPELSSNPRKNKILKKMRMRISKIAEAVITEAESLGIDTDSFNVLVLQMINLMNDVSDHNSALNMI